MGESGFGDFFWYRQFEVFRFQEEQIYQILFIGHRAGIETESPESHEAQAEWLEDLQWIARPFALSQVFKGEMLMRMGPPKN